MPLPYFELQALSKAEGLAAKNEDRRVQAILHNFRFAALNIQRKTRNSGLCSECGKNKDETLTWDKTKDAAAEIRAFLKRGSIPERPQAVLDAALVEIEQTLLRPPSTGGAAAFTDATLDTEVKTTRHKPPPPLTSVENLKRAIQALTADFKWLIQNEDKNEVGEYLRYFTIGNPFDYTWANKGLGEDFHREGLLNPARMKQHYEGAVLYSGLIDRNHADYTKTKKWGKALYLSIPEALALTQKYPVIWKLNLATMYIKLTFEETARGIIWPKLNKEDKELYSAIQALFDPMLGLLKLLLQAIIPPQGIQSAARTTINRAVGRLLTNPHALTIQHIITETLYPFWERPEFNFTLAKLVE